LRSGDGPFDGSEVGGESGAAEWGGLELVAEDRFGVEVDGESGGDGVSLVAQQC
jgi:hypothetical protein